jgi:hypothetical protein
MTDIIRNHDFSALPPGSPIVSDDVDEEFDALFARINDLPFDSLSSDAANRFLKLKTVQSRFVNWGGFTLNFAAAPSADVTVPHGLGATPTFALLSRGVDADNVLVSLMQYQAADATNIYVRGITSSALTFAAPGFWLAIAAA